MCLEIGPRHLEIGVFGNLFLKHIIFAFSLGVAIGAEITHLTFEHKV